MTNIRSWQEADKYLGAKDERPLANNTRIRRRDDHAIVIRLHETDIITYFPAEAAAGAIALRTGGWLTPTTKHRLNTYGPEGFRVWQERGQWSLCNWRTREAFPWAEGITVQDGQVYNAGDLGEVERVKRLQKKIRTYAEGFVQALLAGKVPAPSGGDCWACLGLTGDHSHVEQHIEESYFVPTLLVHAIEAHPVGPLIRQRVGELLGAIPAPDYVNANIDDITSRQVKSSLVRYLRHAVGIA
jgi:hypothetical protein